MSAKIALTQGQVSLVDDEDYAWLSLYRWHAVRDDCINGFYASRNIAVSSKQKAMRMHRTLLGLKFGDKSRADHINGDTLDNRKCNLRIATSKQNSFNRKRASNNKSGFKGVYWKKEHGKWAAQCKINNIGHIGYFSNKRDAAQAYIFVAHINYGEFARMG